MQLKQGGNEPENRLHFRQIFPDSREITRLSCQVFRILYIKAGKSGFSG